MKRFGSTFLAVAILISSVIYATVNLARPISASAQQAYVILGTQTALTGCVWPTAYATVTNGLALCPLNLSTGPALAISVNQGAFVQIPMTTATTGVQSFNGRTGAVTLTDADITGTGLKVATTVTGTFTATSTPQ